MVIKTIAMLAMYLVPFVLILAIDLSFPLYMLMWIIMGVGMAGVGLSVMHDANHGAYSKNEFINKLVGNGLGAILTGLFSDLLARYFGNDGLRMALLGMVCMLLPAVAAFWLAKKAYPSALERANLNASR